MKSRVTSVLFSLILAALTTAGIFQSASAAEKIKFIVGPLRLSLNISSLESFAANGTVDRRLADYFRFAGSTEAEKNEFREILLKPIAIDPVLLSRLLRTDMGEDLLSRWGEYITIQGGRNGKYALRGAMVESAFDDNGLSLINVFRHLPTNIQINVGQALSLAEKVDLIITATNFFRQEISQLAQQEIELNAPIDYAALPDLRQRGKFGVEKNSWQLTDTSRERTFTVDIYQPKDWQGNKIPVVIASHGLGASPEYFADSGEHLASHGYVLVVPQHPGSDSKHIEALKAGRSNQIFLTREFIDRPQDIRYSIDELERRNQKEFAGQLDLNNVAVIGHSFGGYTALALAGASIEFDHLEPECQRRLNISLLLQCRALSLEPQSERLKDERVKAIAITNPFQSAIFGPQGLARISLPVFVQAGKYDPATPFVLEQVRPFPWLNTPDKYLSLQEGDTHVDIRELDAGISELIYAFSYLSLPEPGLLTSYNHALMLAFLEVHLLGNEDYRPYLQSAYAAYLSQGQEFKNFLITHASAEGLEEAIARFKAKHPNLNF